MAGDRASDAPAVMPGVPIRRVLAGVVVCTLASVALGGPRTDDSGNFLRLTGSADWEVYRSRGVSDGTPATFQAIRQKYGLDLAGSLWDPRFNRFSLGVDFFRADREVDGTELDSDTIGYRAFSTFFPGRSFPLQLYARRSTTDVAGIALADSNRETSAWGAEWNLVTPKQQNVRLLYDRTGFDLVSPIALEERRNSGLVSLSQRFRRSEASVRYDLQNQKEMVNRTDFKRQNLAIDNRTRFDSGATWVVSGNRTLSDARFSTGERDELTLTRLTSVLDLPRRNRVGWNLSLDLNDNQGKFLDSNSGDLKARVRVRISEHWDSTAGGGVGRVETKTAGGDVEQDIYGTNARIAYHRDWDRVDLSGGYSVGWVNADFNVGPDRRLITQEIDLVSRLSLGGTKRLLASVSRKEDENDTSGLGFTFDETRADLGLEGSLGENLSARGSIYARDTVNDTFQFGVQESDEYGFEGSMTHTRGSVSVNVGRRKGVSDFLPDPGGNSVFVPGTDLVNQSDYATIGTHWRLPFRLQFRMQARFEAREFTSIGKEQIRYYYPQLDWSRRVWRFSLGYSHYERDNTTTFSDDSWLLKISRRFS